MATKKTKDNKRVLVIGDAHVDEHQTLDRFDSLGNYIIEEQPDVIIIIGDFLSMNCFSNYDRPYRMKMEGKRRKLEIDAANTALDKMTAPTIEYNKKRRRRKSAQYRPKIVYMEGNHEARESIYIEQNPELEGSLDYKKDLKLAERGITHFPYKHYYYINGIGFCHVPMNAVNKPVSGIRIMQTVLDLHGHSVVFGHTHKLKIEGQHRHGDKHFQQVLNVGCFFEHVEEYTKGSKMDFWRGIVMLDMYSEQRFDITTVSLSSLKKRY